MAPQHAIRESGLQVAGGALRSAQMLSLSSKLGRTVLVLSIAFAAAAGAVGALGGGEAAALALLVAFAVTLAVAIVVAGRGTKPTWTREEAAAELGLSVKRVDFLIADGVLDVQRNPDGSPGIIRESVERERRYSAEAPWWRRLLRRARRVAWWMPP